jgi:hypothetical protein
MKGAHAAVAPYNLNRKTYPTLPQAKKTEAKEMTQHGKEKATLTYQGSHSDQRIDCALH